VVSPGCISDRDGDGSGADDPTASWRDPGFAQTDDHPVVCVSWRESSDFAAWLGRKTGKPYRLLSESEWEFVARAGTTTTFFWGSKAEDGCAFMNAADRTYKRGQPRDRNVFVDCDDGVVFTAPVGHYPPNPFGLLDVTGNAWEIVADCYEPTLTGIPTDGRARTAEVCNGPVVRGGSFDDYPEDFRLARRQHIGPDMRVGNIGFRVARDLDARERAGRAGVGPAHRRGI